MIKDPHISDADLVERVLANDGETVLYFFYEKYYSMLDGTSENRSGQLHIDYQIKWLL